MADKTDKIVIDMNDLTLGQIDEAQRLMDKSKVNEAIAFTYVFLKADKPETTLADVAKIKMRDLKLVELETDESDADPN